MLKFITNAQKNIQYSEVQSFPGSTLGEKMAKYKKWRSQFLEMEPRATEEYSSAVLKAMGLVGLYEQVNKI